MAFIITGSYSEVLMDAQKTIKYGIMVPMRADPQHNLADLTSYSWPLTVSRAEIAIKMRNSGCQVLHVHYFFPALKACKTIEFET